eukprot:3825962-Pleurochrysis_carterae.AAC.1
MLRKADGLVLRKVGLPHIENVRTFKIKGEKFRTNLNNLVRNQDRPVENWEITHQGSSIDKNRRISDIAGLP